MTGTILLIVLVLLVLIFVGKGLFLVPQQNVVMIERLGRFHRKLESGLNWIMPFFDKARRIPWRTMHREGNYLYPIDTSRKFIDLREVPFDIPPQNVITKDNVSVKIDGLIYFQITDPVKAVYEITNFFQGIEKLTQTSLRSLVGDMDLDETLSGRDSINTKLTKVMDESTDKWGVKVHRVEIQDIMPPPEVQQAMEKQMKAERERRATVTEAEGRKRSDILTSEGEMQKMINLAEGEKQAVIRKAEAQKRQLELRGEGEMAFINSVRQGVGDKTLTEYLLGIKYIEMIPQMFGGENKMVVPYDAMGLMGAIKSIEHVVGKSIGSSSPGMKA